MSEYIFATNTFEYIRHTLFWITIVMILKVELSSLTIIMMLLQLWLSREMPVCPNCLQCCPQYLAVSKVFFFFLSKVVVLLPESLSSVRPFVRFLVLHIVYHCYMAWMSKDQRMKSRGSKSLNIILSSSTSPMVIHQSPWCWQLAAAGGRPAWEESLLCEEGGCWCWCWWWSYPSEVREVTYALRRLRLSYSNEIVIQIEHALSGERLVLFTRGNGVLCWGSSKRALISN